MPFHTPPSAEIAGYAGFALFEALSDLLNHEGCFDAKRGRRTPRENSRAPSKHIQMKRAGAQRTSSDSSANNNAECSKGTFCSRGPFCSKGASCSKGAGNLLSAN
jgi:hypothetical protein